MKWCYITICHQSIHLQIFIFNAEVLLLVICLVYNFTSWKLECHKEWIATNIMFLYYKEIAHCSLLYHLWLLLLNAPVTTIGPLGLIILPTCGFTQASNACVKCTLFYFTVLFYHQIVHFTISFSNLGAGKWKANNLQLARENVRLKKAIQKWTRLHVENALRYNVLEMSWRHRGVSNFTLDKMVLAYLCHGSKVFETCTSKIYRIVKMDY